MKRFAFAAFSLLLVWTVGRLVAQDGSAPVLDPFAEEPSQLGSESSVADESPGEDVQRNRFLEIMRAKAELMEDAELEAAIQQAEAEIYNLQASRMLTDARETLLQLIESYPQTPAAQDARRMLSLEIAPTIQPMPLEEDFQPSFTAPAESIGVEIFPDLPTFDQPILEPVERR